MKNKFIEAHMQVAEIYAQLSSAKRLKVGCVIVKNDTIIGIGYNGMPSGWTNECEDKEFMSGDAGGWLDAEEIEERWPFEVRSDEDDTYIGRYTLKTKDKVIHAEINAICKIAKSTNSSDGAAIFITHAPCIECAKTIHQSGISSVFYRDTYRTDDGVKFLQQCGVQVQHIESEK